MSFVKRARTFYWIWYLKAHGAKVGKNVKVNGPMDILLRDNADWGNIDLGDNVNFTGKTYFRLRKNGKITLKNGVMVGTEVWLVSANDAELAVGEDTILNSYSIFNGGHGLKIGPNCIFAAFVYINTSDHNFKKGEMIQEQGFFGAPIEIGEDVWLGGQVFVNKGVKIGDGAVIGAGSVVVRDIPDYKIAVGNPAAVVKDRI